MAIEAIMLQTLVCPTTLPARTGACKLLTTCISLIAYNGLIRQHTVSNAQDQRFFYNGDQTHGPLSGTLPSTSGFEANHSTPSLHASVTPQHSVMEMASSDEPSMGIQAGGGCSARLPHPVQPAQKQILRLRPVAACIVSSGTQCDQNDSSMSDRTAYMTSDASTRLDKEPMVLDKNIVSVYTSRDGPPVEQQSADLAVAKAQPVSPRRKSSNNSERPSLSAEKPSRMSHSQVERRYRNTIKFHLDILTTKLPALKEIRASTPDPEESNCIIKGPSKALVIASAVKHIESLESDNAEAKRFIRALQEQIEGLQNLVRDSDCAIRHHLQADGNPQA
jgi:hypothetical protein